MSDNEDKEAEIVSPNPTISSRPSSHKRNIQPQQQKCKGVTRIVNGPKKNAVVTRINNRESRKQQLSDTTDKAEAPKEPNVYDRLYNARSSKERLRAENNK
jgi:hypothetical protein